METVMTDLDVFQEMYQLAYDLAPNPSKQDRFLSRNKDSRMEHLLALQKLKDATAAFRKQYQRAYGSPPGKRPCDFFRHYDEAKRRAWLLRLAQMAEQA